MQGSVEKWLGRRQEGGGKCKEQDGPGGGAGHRLSLLLLGKEIDSAGCEVSSPSPHLGALSLPYHLGALPPQCTHQSPIMEPVHKEPLLNAQHLGSLLLGSRPSWVSVCQVYAVWSWKTEGQACPSGPCPPTP